MSNELSIPPCSYCGAPTEPVRQRKLNSTKHFYCSKACTDKNTLLEQYKDILGAHKLDTKVIQILKTGIDMLYSSQLMDSQDCVFLFTDSLYSFKLDQSVKPTYSNLLQSKGEELIRTGLSASAEGKSLIRKV